VCRLQGKPASGKSTLMKYIRMDLDNRLRDLDSKNASGRIVIDFFYSDRGGPAQQGHEWMLRSLLYQLLSTHSNLWNCYRSKFEEFRQLGHQHWQLQSLKEMFSIIKACRLALTIYVLIDAMDESDQEKREEILKLLSDVCDSEGCLVLKILVASRPVPRIASAFNKYITITLEDETTVDIIRFTSKRMDGIGEILRTDMTEVQDIHAMIVERSRGVFLWVQLVLNELENMVHDGCNLFQMKGVLESLPQDLDAFYAHMLESRLPKIGTSMHTETLKMLQWVAYSSRSLTLFELTEAVAVAASDSCGTSLQLIMIKGGRPFTLDQANRMILTRCGGFLEVKNGIVQFIHQTVRDFLFNLPATSSLYISERESIESIATTCLRYLKFINEQIAQKREGWQCAERETQEHNSIYLDFLKSSRLALLNFAAYANPMYRSDKARDSPVFRNLESARQEFTLLNKNFIQRAIHSDRTADINCLLQYGVEIDQEDTDAIRPFLTSKSVDHYCFPACGGYSYIINWLISACGWSIGNALRHASSEGHGTGMQYILEYGVPDKDIFEAVSKAVKSEQWGMLEMMLKHGFKEENMYKAFYNSLRNEFAGSGDRTARILHHAASKGYVAIVRFFLKHGEEISSTDDDGRIALHFAAEGGHEEIVQLLLDHGADKEATTNNGSTALQAAAHHGHLTVVERLLQANADVNAGAAEAYGRTALQAAAAGGHLAVVERLLQANADVNAGAAEHGWTALLQAAAGGHLAVVERLLQANADVNAGAAEAYGRTALQAAAAGGHLAVVERLLQVNADVNAGAAAEYGWTALQAAAAGGHLAVVERLLQANADVNAGAAAEHGRTALQQAAEGGHLDLVERLLQANADVNAGAATEHGRMALQAAAAGGHLAVVERLLQANADVNAGAAAKYGRTALQAAAAGGHLAVVERLLQAKADVLAITFGSGCRTALQAADDGGHSAVVKRLRAAGAN